MIVLSLLLSLLYAIFGALPSLYISYIVLGTVIFRMLSRNIYRRRAENDKFIKYWWPIRTKIKRVISNIKQRKTYKFIKCPGCKNKLRLPRGKGKIQISCPKCTERFIRKT
jgi:LSD1 subclass zinc finger protein